MKFSKIVYGGLRMAIGLLQDSREVKIRPRFPAKLPIASGKYIRIVSKWFWFLNNSSN